MTSTHGLAKDAKPAVAESGALTPEVISPKGMATSVVQPRQEATTVISKDAIKRNKKLQLKQDADYSTYIASVLNVVLFNEYITAKLASDVMPTFSNLAKYANLTRATQDKHLPNMEKDGLAYVKDGCILPTERGIILNMKLDLIVDPPDTVLCMFDTSTAVGKEAKFRAKIDYYIQHGREVNKLVDKEIEERKAKQAEDSSKDPTSVIDGTVMGSYTPRHYTMMFVLRRTLDSMADETQLLSTHEKNGHPVDKDAIDEMVRNGWMKRHGTKTISYEGTDKGKKLFNYIWSGAEDRGDEGLAISFAADEAINTTTKKLKHRKRKDGVVIRLDERDSIGAKEL